MSGLERVIAVVDDDEGVRDAMDNLLTSWGYRTELYASAEEFVVFAKESKAACLVLDVELGDVTGVELARHLAANGFTFPIIFLTGSANEAKRQQAMELGCVAYLHKPCPADKLMQAILRAIGGNIC